MQTFQNTQRLTYKIPPQELQKYVKCIQYTGVRKNLTSVNSLVVSTPPNIQNKQ